MHSKFGHILPWSLLEGIELLTQGIKHHYYTIMLIKCLEDIIQGSILAQTPGQVSQELLQLLEDMWQQMLVVPTQVAENSYVPPPQVICHSILGLFILDDLQIDHHPRTPSLLCWSVAFS